MYVLYGALNMVDGGWWLVTGGGWRLFYLTPLFFVLFSIFRLKFIIIAIERAFEFERIQLANYTVSADSFSLHFPFHFSNFRPIYS